MNDTMKTLLIFWLIAASACVGEMGGSAAPPDDVTPPDDSPPVDAPPDEVVDREPPVVVVTMPERGAFVDGPLLTVQGRVVTNDAREVVIDGNSVAVNERGDFSYSAEVAPGAYNIRVSATDDAGNTGWAMTSALVGEYLPGDQAVERATVLQIGGDALDELGSGIAPHISPENIEPALLGHGHLASGFWGWLDASGYDHGAVTVALEPSRELTVTVTVDDIRVPLRADLRIGPDITGTASADRAVITVSARVGAEDGRPVVELVETDVTLYGMLVDIDGLWSWLDRNVVTSLLRGRVEGELDALAAAQVPRALEQAIERIPMTQVVRVRDRAVVLRGEVRALTSSVAGLRLFLDLGVDPIGEDAELLGAAPGSLTMNPSYPDISLTPDVRAQVSLDLINAALYAAWSTNALEVNVVEPAIGAAGPLTAAAIELIAPGTRGLAPTSAPVSIEVTATLPPVAQPSDDDESLLEVRAPDLNVRIYATTGDAEVDLIELAVGVRARVRASIRDDELAIDASDFVLTADPVGADVGLPVADDLDQLMMDLIAPVAADFVRLEGLRIPQLYGFSATDLSLELDGGYLVAEARLDYAP